ncbi:twin arginine translocase protein A [Pasteurella multocida subsp. multocida str. Anand1_buffalo]|nr:twin arginine translocase protein A [Pasteurella multocida subsp. multocida str. Anand1_buffalo]
MGESVKGFKKAMADDNKEKDAEFKSLSDDSETTAKTEKAKDKEQA